MNLLKLFELRKIAIITGTRAEFGLLRPLIDIIESNDDYDLQLVVTAMHLSPEFGYTISEIEKANYRISKKVECVLSSDSAVGVSKSVGLALIGFADALDSLSPDFVFILGDRSEMLAAATAAMFANIPIGHIHGGDTTEGAYDEGIRHAITKMSYLHFASTEVYRKRIIQLGEAPERVFNVGAISLDSIKNLRLLSRADVEKSLDIKLARKNVLITYHPVTLEKESAKEQFQTILNALDTLKNTQLIFTHANSDKDGRLINHMIEDFVQRKCDKAVSFKSLGQLRYLSALQYVDFVIGNSSSGIVEVPYFNVPTINVGDRQKGRLAPQSVINCSSEKDSILAAIQQAFDPEFKKEITHQKQIYGRGNTSELILKIIKEISTEDLKKRFFDINFVL